MSAPLYLRIRAQFEERIRSGDLPPGARLPTEAELREQHGVSRATAQRVLHELAQAGLVVRHRRRGTFVAEGVRQENLLRLINPRLRGPEIPGRHAVHSAAVVPAAESEVDLPGIDGGTPVTQLVRLKFDADENPLALEITAVPFALAPHLLDEDLAELTMMVYFGRTGVPIARSRMYLDAILLEPHQAELLGMDTTTPLVRQRRYTWLTNGELAESGAYLMRPGAMEFFVEHSVLAEGDP
ncbi:GntR family transcriptional regulator [Amycolatopsis minnesotensis]|uniref:GntR family transcriptional regulator n=1 Tax=Amycolatopsis minnesotensis TaxID=337894 RepID=A0ABN2QRL0_9PSEU